MSEYNFSISLSSKKIEPNYVEFSTWRVITDMTGQEDTGCQVYAVVVAIIEEACHTYKTPPVFQSTGENKAFVEVNG